VKAHLRPLLLCHDVGTLCLVPLWRNDVTLFVQTHELVVHLLDRNEFILEQLLLFDQEGLSLTDGSCDLLAGALTLVTQLELESHLHLNVFLELHLLQFIVT